LGSKSSALLQQHTDYGNQSEQKSNATVFSGSFENYGDKVLLILDLLI
jgi:hypothetical protein